MIQWASLMAKRVGNSMPVLKLVRRVESVTENRLSERGMIAQAFEFVKVNQVRGDYMEFGLWQGRTFLHARRMKKLHRVPNMHLWGFDSFEGLPPVEKIPGEIWHGGQFACSLPQFRKILATNSVAPDEYTLVEGYYDRSLNAALHERLKGRTAAIVYIDCDLYESTVPVLRFIEPYLTSGTVVCFDDFYCYAGRPDQGEQLALREFLAAHPELEFQRYLTYCPVGQSFIVHRRDGAAGRAGSV